MSDFTLPWFVEWFVVLVGSIGCFVFPETIGFALGLKPWVVLTTRVHQKEIWKLMAQSSPHIVATNTLEQPRTEFTVVLSELARGGLFVA